MAPPSAPAFSGGEKLQAALAAIDGKLARADGPYRLRVGFLEDAAYPDGKSVAYLAAIQEFGAPRARIPSRPFFRNMVAAKKAEWPAAVTELMRSTNYDSKQVLTQAGFAI